MELNEITSTLKLTDYFLRLSVRVHEVYCSLDYYRKVGKRKMNLSTATRRNKVKHAEICIFAALLRIIVRAQLRSFNANSFLQQTKQPLFASGAKTNAEVQSYTLFNNRFIGITSGQTRWCKTIPIFSVMMLSPIVSSGLLLWNQSPVNQLPSYA